MAKNSISQGLKEALRNQDFRKELGRISRLKTIWDFIIENLLVPFLLLSAVGLMLAIGFDEGRLEDNVMRLTWQEQANLIKSDYKPRIVLITISPDTPKLLGFESDSRAFYASFLHIIEQFSPSVIALDVNFPIRKIPTTARLGTKNNVSSDEEIKGHTKLKIPIIAVSTIIPDYEEMWEINSKTPLGNMFAVS